MNKESKKSKKTGKKKRKIKISFKPNPETMLIRHDVPDRMLAELINNPRRYRKTEEEMSR